MKRFICIICSFVFTLSSTLYAFAYKVPSDGNARVLSAPLWMQPDLLIDNENLPVSHSNLMMPEERMGQCEPYGNMQKFTNFVDGYSIVVPADMNIDMSLSDVCASLSGTNILLKIFKETFSTAGERQSYIDYSNKFIQNTTNHVVEEDKTYTSNGREIHLLQWSRKKLSKIENDKNYYACIDVCEGARVYTFFFTSDVPFYRCGGYTDIINSLKTFDPSVPSANAYNKGYKKTGVSHLNSTVRAKYNKLFSENSEFKLGMFPPDQYGGIEKMEEFEEKFNYEFCAFLEYTEVTDKFGMTNIQYEEKLNSYMSRIASYFRYAQSSGKALELTLQPPLMRNTGSNMVYEILDGEFDLFLEKYAKLVSEYPKVTVLFRPFNEMNGDWCSYSAFHTSRDTEIYKNLYKYVYGFFKEAGCSNVLWVWNPNERSYPNYKWNNESMYYPGDEFVDIYGITGYNNGTYYESELWRSFDEIYTPIYERALRINEKPIMITEFSCSSVGGDKVEWLENMFLSLPDYDKIKVGIWWHAADYDGDTLARPYFMDTPDGMLEVFDKYLD